MTFALQPVADPAAPLARRNPVAKLAAAMLFTLPLIATLDPLTPALALVIELTLLPLFGLRYATLARRAWPLVAAAIGVMVTMVLFAADRGGALLLDLGPFDITTDVLVSALGLVLRLFAIALPGVIVFATTDPTDLADALVQNAKAPARFAIGALAAFRLLPLLGEEWQMLTLARRARGVETGIRGFPATAFALLVGALRRGGRLAVAMDARGFDSSVERTYARRQIFTGADVLLMIGALTLAAVVLATTVLTGLFRPIIG
ncbi:energy-coupling factor transporter transmembrane component T family protein [Actinoplanes sp. NPDC051513]|uniref:energy-coupling factor transporter transmembrane component T family protein n=1 Tax=Actinoplanes sp. NPDC051513 TaxID=3363908 RepID=UPI0037A96D4F